MTTYGATSAGFIRPTDDEIRAEIKATLQDPSRFGADADLSPYSPLGHILEMRVEQERRLWDAIEANYYAAYLPTADGVELDRLGVVLGAIRKPALNEQVDLVFTGENNTIIPAGFTVQTKSRIRYKTLVDGEIAGGTATITAKAEESGVASRVDPGTLIQIVNPLEGVYSVTNPQASVGGNARENDVVYRARIEEAANVSARDVGALSEYKVLLEADPDVRSVYIIENNLSVENPVNGMPANSVHFVVDGGTPSHIASLIFKYAAAGIELVGAIEQTVTDDYGQDHIVRFSKPTEVSIFVRIRVQTGSGWDPTNVAAIQGKAVEIIGGTHTYTDDQGNPVSVEYIGLGTGADVLPGKLFAALFGFAGVLDATITFGTDSGDVTHDSIAIAPDEIAKTQTGYITVEPYT